MYCGFLMLISFDGFMWNYLEKHGLHNFPNFIKIIETGTLAKHVKNQFLTKTFPNHYTIVSGTYEEYHGLVNNEIFDERYNITFNPGDTSCVWWGDAPEPIWITNQQTNKHCLNKSGAYMWPGSNVKIKNQMPTYYTNFTKKYPLSEKFKDAIQAISNNLINFAVIYHHQPDESGHLYGPYSQNVADQIKKIDNDLGYLLGLVADHGLSNILNIIITSDHGMTQMNSDKKIILSKHFDVSNEEVVFSGSSPTWNIFSNNSQLLNQIKSVFGAKLFEGKLKIYAKSEIPDRWHYKNNRRIGDLLLVGEPDWTISMYPDSYDLAFNGNHGYDNELPDSWPIFLATGPAFRKGFVSEPINNIDVYELMCAILNVNPAPNNGSIESIKHLLTQDMPILSHTSLKSDSSVVKLPESDNLKSRNHALRMKHYLWMMGALLILCIYI